LFGLVGVLFLVVVGGGLSPGGRPVVGPDIQANRSHEQTDTADTPRSRHGNPTTKKQGGPVTTHGALLEVHARDVYVVCITDLGGLFSPQHPPTDIPAPFYTHHDDCTRLFSFFLFVLFSSISPNTYGLLLSWLVHLLRSTSFHLDWTFFWRAAAQVKTDMDMDMDMDMDIWTWLRLWVDGGGYVRRI
jgi:hypothetical protein